MLETHSTKGNYRDFFVGPTKATVFHLEIMEESSKGSKKILETTTTDHRLRGENYFIESSFFFLIYELNRQSKPSSKLLCRKSFL